MSIFINTNMAAIGAAQNLGKSNAALQQALGELSSGSKIVNSSDDPGGLAVAMNLDATISETQAASTGVADANSFLQTQDGALTVAGNVLNRIAELSTLASDPTKSTSDITNYNDEFTALKTQLTQLSSGTFNNVALFGGGSLSVATSSDGALTQSITQANLATAVSAVTGAANLAAITTVQINTAISNVAADLAQNGAESSSLTFAGQTLSTNATNLQAAVSQITDVDVAAESTQLAKDEILVQAGVSMLSHANSNAQVVLKLLQ